ncbi:MAG TPA: PEP-CTERM sorting domain-containing protein, partial [Pirellulales bacterium]
GTLKFSGTSTFVRSNHAIPYDIADVIDVADANGDNSVNNLDIQAEITAIANGGVFGGGSIATVPEPASVVIFGLALPAIGLAWRRRSRKLRG